MEDKLAEKNQYIVEHSAYIFIYVFSFLNTLIFRMVDYIQYS